MTDLIHALRDLRRRPLRSALTAAGVAVGVAALVLLGGLAERAGRLIGGGRDFASGQITVAGAGTGGMMGFARGALLTREQLRRVAEVPGVRRVAPIVMFPVGDAASAFPLALPPHVFGIEPDALRENPRAVPAGAATAPAVPAGPDEVAVGVQVARRFGVAAGDTLTVRGRAFRVVEVLAPTLTGPDSFVFMAFPTAQRLLLDTEPLLRRLALAPGAEVLPIATAAAVFWDATEDPEVVAERVRGHVEGVAVLSPADAAGQVDRALVVVNGLVLGTALAALLVASLAVVNTMLTAVVERRRELGLLRVVGATRAQMVRRLLVEAGALGVAGGVAGVAGGAAAAAALNAVTARAGAAAFLVTPRLVAAALVLPAALAVVGGLWPARRAARLAPLEAVRWA
jgi:putative ABC transport system permease protein